ncbi:MAG: preprotein translocase subunit SecA [Alphaproteobacteria bacterium]|nr:preprotein translocase subunit SecA [Alphaproteobacteria bacterium]MBL0717776.1 preprotein translocase subunit SecA [Alphaproteobacteria bacterium]
MIKKILYKFKSLKSSNTRLTNKYINIVDEINLLEDKYTKMSEEELKGETGRLRKKLETTSLDDILVESFATVKEASKRVLNMKHYNMQLLGGIALHKSYIAEMKTGEGKTLVATLALYLNSLSGKGAHLITVNDYLAQRDSKWMGTIFEYLGLTIGCVIPNMDDIDRKQAYLCDITYVTNHDIGFDYLRDNMKTDKEDQVLRPFNFGIIDEADNILIDEARTPLIISQPSDKSSELYGKISNIVKQLQPSCYKIEEKHRTIQLNDIGFKEVEKLLIESGLLQTGDSLFDLKVSDILHMIQQGLSAHFIFKREDHYIVRDDKVLLVDEFTGRILDGRQLSKGLHQAIEAKEGITINPENSTAGSITYQNLFRLYPHLSGMTGTASTEAVELQEIYKLDVLSIPTHKNILRRDHHDKIFRTKEEKYSAIIDKVKECHKKGQPILIGTTSIEKSDILSNKLKREGIKHSVLNAKFHAKEADIISQAGCLNAVTIATNMAGRGTDIKLGGSVDDIIDIQLSGQDCSLPSYISKVKELTIATEKNREEVLKSGGLCIIGTERHESRRIDLQLRGRSGRQGDIGESIFFLSLEDDLLRIFGAENLKTVLKRFGLKEGEAISHPFISKAIVKAQKKIETLHFDSRKDIFQYDEIVHEQRKVVYNIRQEILTAKTLSPLIKEFFHDTIEQMMNSYIPEKSLPFNWDLKNFEEKLSILTGDNIPLKTLVKERELDDEKLFETLNKHLEDKLHNVLSSIETEKQIKVIRFALVSSVDDVWRKHLNSLEFTRSSIGLRGYAQKNPLSEYKHESFNIFQDTIVNLKHNSIQFLLRHDLRQFTDRF